MAKRRKDKFEEIECSRLCTRKIDLVDENGGILGFIEGSHFSFFTEALGNGLSGAFSLGQKGKYATLGLAGKDNFVVGFNAVRGGRKVIFVNDENNRPIFAAGIDINGERFIELLAEDGTKIWEVRGTAGTKSRKKV